MVKGVIEHRLQAVSDPRIDHQLGLRQSLGNGTLQQVQAGEWVGAAGEEQHRHIDGVPVTAARLPFRRAGSMERIAEADEAGTGACPVGGKQAGDAATIGLASQDESRGWLRTCCEVLSVGRDCALSLAQRQIDSRGAEAPGLQPLHVPLHGGRPAGCAVGHEDVHRPRVAESCVT